MSPMKFRSLIAAAAVAVVSLQAVSSVEAQSSDSHPIIGTWRLNVEASSFEPGPGPRGVIRRFLETDDGFVVSIRITADQAGNPNFAMVRLKLDGEAYEVWTTGGLGAFVTTGDRPTNTAAFTRVDDNTLKLTQTNNGEVAPLSPNTWAVSSDGSTLTVTTSGTTPQGDAVNNVEVYDRWESDNQ